MTFNMVNLCVQEKSPKFRYIYKNCKILTHANIPVLQ